MALASLASFALDPPFSVWDASCFLWLTATVTAVVRGRSFCDLPPVFPIWSFVLVFDFGL